jgi:hypothetical protein
LRKTDCFTDFLALSSHPADMSFKNAPPFACSVIRGPRLRTGRRISMNETLPIKALLSTEFSNRMPNCFHRLRISSITSDIDVRRSGERTNQFAISNINQESVIENKASMPDSIKQVDKNLRTHYE